MERLIVIILSALVGTAFYFWCVLILKKESAREYVRARPFFLHPNAICYWRTVMAFCGYYLYFWTTGHQSLAIFIFTFAAILDGVDGVVARKCNLISQKGASLDPLCDKLTYLPPLLNFSFLGIMSTELVLILTLIEFVGQFFTRPILKHFCLSVAANNFGKIKAIICFGLVIYGALLDAEPHLINICNEVLISTIILSSASMIFKFIPNRLYADILSLLNFCCGIVSLIYAHEHHFVLATIAILTGQMFDLFDGRMAEKYGGTKAGPYLDDMADFVSFGICPAYIIYLLGNGVTSILGVCFIIGIAYRLIRFVLYDKKRTDLPPGIFNGLPGPAGALIILGSTLSLGPTLLSIAIIVSIGLMVSNIRFAHFGRVILKKLPKPIFFLFGAFLIITLTYITKIRDPQLFGYLLLFSAMIYIMTGRKMAMDICRSPQ